ncbi:MAG: hypothetical protein WB660_04235 [Candidatus Sulfotelmatobacter sp.]
MPGKKHGSGTGDRWHGGKGSRYDGPLTPLGRFSKPFVTGPNRIPFFNEESSDDDRQQVVAESEGEERLGTTIAIGRAGLEVVHPHAAGIDVGNSAHYVAVRPDRDPEPVRRFECFTADLYRLAEWLASCGVKTVALQSTGVY